MSSERELFIRKILLALSAAALTVPAAVPAEAHSQGRTWRGDDGRFYCRRPNGTTGLVVGGAAGALAGREIAGRGDRTVGAILGAGVGALAGRAIQRAGSRCR